MHHSDNQSKHHVHTHHTECSTHETSDLCRAKNLFTVTRSWWQSWIQVPAIPTSAFDGCRYNWVSSPRILGHLRADEWDSWL